MTFLDELLPLVEAKMDAEERKRQYLHDPVLWASDMLGVRLWSKQREIAYAVRDNHNVAVAAGHGGGKDMPLDTPIATPTGWSTMGELRVGDQVFDERGKPCRVVAKSEVFNNPLFKVTFSDGAEAITSGTHEWNTIDFRTAKNARRRQGGVTDWRNHWDLSATRTTAEIAATIDYDNGGADSRNHSIPISGALDIPDADLPIDPYVLGAWLGDGSSDSAHMTIGADGEYMIDEFAAKGYVLTKLSARYLYSFGRQGFRDAARALGVFKNKHIPDLYLRASIAQRRDLLRGIMDTDGFHCHNSKCGIDLMSEPLARGVAELIRSLGVKCSLRPGRTYLDGRDVGTRYRMVFNPLSSPFTKGQYKDQAWVQSPRASAIRTARTIVSVEPIESVPTQCIQVDSPRNLYLATQWMIPTHNSHLASILMAWWADVHPIEEVKILSTAPTFPQTSILWDNLRNWHTIARKRYDEYLLRRSIGADLGEFRYNDHPLPGHIAADNVWKTDSGVRIGFGRKPPDNLLDSAFQGEHAPFLLAIGDEGAGLPAELVDALGNNASGSENRVLLIANPTNPNSRMADYWKTKNPNWVTMNISVEDFPTITEEEGFDAAEMEAKGMSGQGYIDDRKADWGEDNPQYIARVKGEWAFESGNNLFTDADLAKAANTVVLPDPEAKPRHGWDIARSGKDYTVGYRCLEGEVWSTDDLGQPVAPTGRRGVQVRLIDYWSKAPLVGHNPENLGSATRINAYAVGEGCTFIAIDATGMGGGVVDGLRELDFKNGRYSVFEYYGAGATTDRRSFVNARAEHYFALKDRMFAEEVDLDPADVKVFDELRGVIYEYDDRGAKKIESKDSQKRRGVKSPDFADSVIYCSCDIAPIVEGPLAGIEKGTKLSASPYDMLEGEMQAVDMPW